jgi:monoterpene epsilon-lactone hydrolase
MASPQFEKLVNLIRSNKQPPGDHPVEKLRAGMERTSLPPGDDITATAVDAGGVPAEWVDAPGADTGRVVLYLHGGGYVMGSPVTHRKLAGDVSRASGARVLLLDYRLAPEHPVPAAIDDAVQAYRWLLQQGVAPASIAVAGDSAGGGLTLATLVALRDVGEPMPAAAVCISPWVDLTGEAASITNRAQRDPMIGTGDLERFTAWYLGGADARESSPVYADLDGLPPLLIHVGDEEVLLDDSVLLAERATAAGVDATLEVWPEMFHVWHVFAGRVPESTEAVEKVGAFLRSKLGAAQPA